MSSPGLFQFKGRTAEEVLQKVHQALGPSAVVVQLKRVTSPGLPRLWGAMEIEAWARPPEPMHPVAKPRRESGKVREIRVKDLLLSWGLQSESIRRVMTHLPDPQAELPPDEGILQAGAGLLAAWDRLSTAVPPAPKRVALIGPPGTGKSVCMAKWLTVEALRHRKACRVWRLDGAIANSSESLALHADLIGVPVEFSWNPAMNRCEQEFLDLPGWNAKDEEVCNRMANLLDRFEPDYVGVVLNLAYEWNVLMSQLKSFQRFRPHALIVTHLDEDASPEKVWNLMLQGQVAVGATSTGPMIPGGFEKTSGEFWMERLFARV